MRGYPVPILTLGPNGPLSRFPDLPAFPLLPPKGVPAPATSAVKESDLREGDRSDCHSH